MSDNSGISTISHSNDDLTLHSSLLIIPGTLCDGRVFDRQLAALRTVANVYVANPAAMKSRESWLDGLIRTLPAKFSVAGFSLGGILALEILRQVPERVQRLALIASNAQPGGPRIRKKNQRLWSLWGTGKQRAVIDRLEPHYFHRERVRRQNNALIRAMALETPWHAARAQFDWAAKRPDAYSAIASFRGPTLLVSGSRDRICTADQQRRMVAVNQAVRWIEFARCGHFLMLEEPTKLGRMLVNWMREPASSQRGV